VIGPVGSPYENGCFEFDILIPPEYPQVPPKCTLVTTGKKAVRFNANLYQNGKVCLSLLGTWQGPGWDPKVSSLLQVVESIPFNIMIGEPVAGHPWFNEPGYMDEHCPSGSEGSLTAFGRDCSKEYNRQIRRCTVKHAMLDMLKHPPPAFKSVIVEHFKSYSETIEAKVKEWTEEEGASGGVLAKLKDMLNIAHSSESMQVVIDETQAVLSKANGDDGEEDCGVSIAATKVGAAAAAAVAAAAAAAAASSAVARARSCPSHRHWRRR